MALTETQREHAMRLVDELAHQITIDPTTFDWSVKDNHEEAFEETLQDIAAGLHANRN